MLKQRLLQQRLTVLPLFIYCIILLQLTFKIELFSYDLERTDKLILTVQ